jgi:hypothetical protein
MISTRYRLAALLALKRGVLILLTTGLMIAVKSLLNRLFDGTWAVNWRAVLAVASILAVLFFLFFLVTGVLEVRREEKSERNLNKEFPAAMWLRGIYLVGIVIGLVCAVGMYREGDSWRWQTIPAIFVLIGYIPWPRAIRITETEIRQARAFGPARAIPVSEIERAAHDPGNGMTTVFGHRQARITHTYLHVDPEGFIREIEQLTGKEVVMLGTQRK